MVTKLRILLVAAALVIAGTSTATASTPPAPGCAAITQKQALDAVIALTQGDDAAALRTLTCAAAQDDAPGLFDRWLCPVMKLLVGAYVVITIGPDGDLILLGMLFWDCPPYEDPPAA